MSTFNVFRLSCVPLENIYNTQGGRETQAVAPNEQDVPSLNGTKPTEDSSTATAWTHPPSKGFLSSPVLETEFYSSVKTAPEVPTLPTPATTSAVASASSSACAYSIGKTKKGGLPVRVESRSKGKKVTVVFNVTGDLKLLLSELKQAAGSGGVVREDTIEIQGDKQQFVENFIEKKIKKK